MFQNSRAILFLSACLLWCATVSADYRDDIGYTALQSELGAGMPNGVGVRVTQAEASTSSSSAIPSYLPDTGNSQFTGKSIIDMSGVNTGGYSGHATAVGSLFYGNSSSMTPGITVIDAYLADTWLNTDYLGGLGGSFKPLLSSSRVANHSWIGTSDDTVMDSDILRRVDYVVARDEFIQVVGTSNGAGTNPPLLSSAYNVIAVGLTNGTNGTSTPSVDATYTAGRTRPDIVAPFLYTSDATPVVASTAALLVGVGHANPAFSNDPVVTSTTNRNGDIIYNAERSEVIKAALMAGADRQTHNASGANIADYRLSPTNQTSNGLDNRFGAGQVNIFNSYHVIAAGEQNSSEDGGAASGTIAANGFDYDPHFGGAGGSNSTATYRFFTTPGQDSVFSASLVWNINIAGGNGNQFSGTATLYDLNLKLFDVTGNPFLLTDSSSTGENTENIWTSLLQGRSYMLEVDPGASQQAFDWDYGLAWHTTALQTTTVPVPAALPLMMSGLAGLFWAGRRRTTG